MDRVTMELAIIWVILGVACIVGIVLINAWMKFCNEGYRLKREIKEKKAEAEKINKERIIREKKEKEEERKRHLIEAVNKVMPLNEKLIKAIKNSSYKDNFYIGDILYDELMVPFILKSAEAYSDNFKENLKGTANIINNIKNDEKLYVRSKNMCRIYNKNEYGMIFLSRGETYDFEILTNGDLIINKNGEFGGLAKYIPGFIHNYQKVFWKENIENPESVFDKPYKWHLVGFVKD